MIVKSIYVKLKAISILRSSNNSNEIKKELYYLVQLNQNINDNDVLLYSEYGS